MKCSLVVLVTVTCFVNAYCVLLSFYVPVNLSSIQKHTHLRSDAEYHPHNANIVRIFDKVSREKRRAKDAMRKVRDVNYSDKIYFPGETNAKTTTNKPVVPATVKIRSRIIIQNGLCPKGYKYLGSWCVPDDGDSDYE